MTLYFRHQGSAIIVYGNTYPVRERLKALGARFNGLEKNWAVPHSDANLELVSGMCKALGGAQIGAAAGGEAVVETSTAMETVTLAKEVVGAAAAGGIAALKKAAAAPLQAGASAAVDDAGLTIRQLMDRVGLAVTQAFPRSIWVVGEIQNVTRRASGLFFDLAEAAEGQHQNATVTVRTILWSSALTMIQSKRGAGLADDLLQDGLKVRMLCQVQLYRDRGHVTLTVDDVDPAYTKGALALAREKLLKELRQKGLDAAQQRLALPPFPFLVGLISADNSRAKSDFLDQLQALSFPGEVLFHAAPMQGEGVPVKVVQALRALEERGVDLIVLTRGGGSAADLRWFDAPEIAYGIARCKVPVVAAIGHHEDVCVAEMICHLRQKTPTAAADFVAGIFHATRQRIDQLAATMAKELTRRANEFNALQAQMSGRLAAAATDGLARREQRLVTTQHRLSTLGLAAVQAAGRKAAERLNTLQFTAERALNARAAAVQTLEQRLVRLDPKPWLEQGWTQLYVGKKAVKRIGDLRPGDQVKARLLDGRAVLTVDGVERAEAPGSEQS